MQLTFVFCQLSEDLTNNLKKQNISLNILFDTLKNDIKFIRKRQIAELMMEMVLEDFELN